MSQETGESCGTGRGTCPTVRGIPLPFLLMLGAVIYMAVQGAWARASAPVRAAAFPGCDRPVSRAARQRCSLFSSELMQSPAAVTPPASTYSCSATHIPVPAEKRRVAAVVRY